MKRMKQYKIFALVAGKQAYVGKTFSRRISVVYQQYCRGERAATCEMTQKEKPTLHVLARGEMQDYEAYRTVLAYIHIFIEAGYQMQNCPRSIERTEDLHPETRKLVEKLHEIPFEEILATTAVRKPTDADDPPKVLPEEIAKEKPDQKVTIRLTPSERSRFNEIGRELRLNQRETMQYLFAKTTQEDPHFINPGDTYLCALMNSYRDQCKKEKDARIVLANRLVEQRKAKNEEITRLRARVRSIKTAVSEYLKSMENASPIPLEVEYGAYVDYQNTREYTYPDEPGVYVLRPQAILFGKGRYRPAFLLGIDIYTGRCLKARYYPRHDYVGESISNSEFMTRGSVWVICCERSKDEAMQLTLSLPVYVRPKKNFENIR